MEGDIYSHVIVACIAFRKCFARSVSTNVHDTAAAKYNTKGMYHVKLPPVNLPLIILTIHI